MAAAGTAPKGVACLNLTDLPEKPAGEVNAVLMLDLDDAGVLSATLLEPLSKQKQTVTTA
jgi:hypothetical protein